MPVKVNILNVYSYFKNYNPRARVALEKTIQVHEYKLTILTKKEDLQYILLLQVVTYLVVTLSKLLMSLRWDLLIGSRTIEYAQPQIIEQRHNKVDKTVVFLDETRA